MSEKHIPRKTALAPLAAAAMLALAPLPAAAQESENTGIREQIEALKERLEELEAKAQQTEQTQTREAEPPHPAAPSWLERLKIHGYGELHYNSREGSDTIEDAEKLPAVLDFHRFVWGVRYRFTDRIVFDSEVDFEHATEELELEFAYLDFLFHDAFNLRMGSVLMPVGALNEFHEPPLFHSVERPYFHKLVIPTSWMEGGVGFHGVAGDFSYRAYVTAGLYALKFSPASGIRKGRQRLMNHEKSLAEDLAFVSRLEWKAISGLQLGASLYTGDSAQDAEAQGKDIGSAHVTIIEGDARYEIAGFELKGEYARIYVGDAGKISAAIDSTMGKRIEGGYVEAAYNVLHTFHEEKELFVFARYEALDTHAEVPAGMTRDPEFARTIRTFGVSYRPIHHVALKADVELWEDDAEQNLTRFNLGFAYDF